MESIAGGWGAYSDYSEEGHRARRVGRRQDDLICLPGADACEQGELEQRPEAIEVWASQLATRFGGRPIAVALEQSRGAVVFALTKYRHLYLYPVHPATLAHFRQAMVPSGAKNDPGDTGLLLELLVHHRARLRRLQSDTEETRELQFLVEYDANWWMIKRASPTG